jgi:cytochrome c553
MTRPLRISKKCASLFERKKRSRPPFAARVRIETICVLGKNISVSEHLNRANQQREQCSALKNSVERKHAQGKRNNGGDVVHVVKRSALILSALVALSGIGAIGTIGARDAIAADAPPLERAPDTMQARVLGCAACHGAHGEGTGNDYFPRLSGKPAGYLYNQLQAFRDGRRKYPPMNYLLAYLPDAYLKEIAAYFAGERPPFPPPSPVKADAKTLDLGKTLVMKGDASRKIPACVSCHGPLMTGMEPAIPGLLGLHADYISAQLGAWRYGTRTALAPDCMAQVSRLLSDRDITAIAAYLASLPAPTDATPIPAASLKMPLVCGSVPN